MIEILLAIGAFILGGFLGLLLAHVAENWVTKAYRE